MLSFCRSLIGFVAKIGKFTQILMILRKIILLQEVRQKYYRLCAWFLPADIQLQAAVTGTPQLCAPDYF
jgi:hypothetical protein